MATFHSKIEKITMTKIAFYNGVTLPVERKELIDVAVDLLDRIMVKVTVKDGKITALEIG